MPFMSFYLSRSVLARYQRERERGREREREREREKEREREGERGWMTHHGDHTLSHYHTITHTRERKRKRRTKSIGIEPCPKLTCLRGEGRQIIKIIILRMCSGHGSEHFAVEVLSRRENILIYLF